MAMNSRRRIIPGPIESKNKVHSVGVIVFLAGVLWVVPAVVAFAIAEAVLRVLTREWIQYLSE